MNDSRSFFAAGARPTRNEALAVAEFEIFQKLAAAGLWSVNLSMSPAPLFRVVADIPHSTVDRYGCRVRRDNFFFCIRYPRLFTGRAPALVWPGDADVPDLPDFHAPSIYYSSLTFERYLGLLFKLKYRGKREMVRLWREYPSVALALDVCTALDEAGTREKAARANLEHVLPERRRQETWRERPAPELQVAERTEPAPEPPTPPKSKFVIKRDLSSGPQPYQEIGEIANLLARLDTIESGKSAPMYILGGAFQAILDHIEWGRSTAQNKVEQGGLIVGTVVQGPRELSCLATATLRAHGTRGSSTYVKFDHYAWKEMFDEFDARVRSGQIGEDQKIIGWYHTHPNMNVFMSGTDMGTQRSLFGRDWNYALVLNPQQQLCGCFRGNAATPAPLVAAAFKEASERSHARLL